MINKRLSSRRGKVIVEFQVPGNVWAERINLVGDFNDWNQESLPFERDHQGNWLAAVELDAGREYRFRYLVDGGQWRDDWHADKSIPNLHGGYDSVIVAQVPEASGPELRRRAHSSAHSKPSRHQKAAPAY